MKIYKTKNYDEMSKRAAHIIASQVILNPDCVLGLATGSTPIGMYENLVSLNKKGDIDFSEVRTFNLDEYYKLPKENDQSYHYFMYKNLFNGIDIKDENVHVPCGQGNIQENCDEYNKMLADKIEYYKETG